MNISAFPRYDIEEFLFDRRTNRYRWRSQSGAGQFASKEAVFARTRTYIEEQKSELRATGQRLIDGRIDLTDFQRQAGQTLKNIHTSQAMLGRDGLENMAANDWLRVGRELQRQYHRGFDRENDRRYGLAHLSREIADGKVSDAQLLNRLSMYGESGKVSYSEAFKAANEGRWAIRRLGATDRHCAFCLEQAAKPAQPIGDVFSIGCCPQCLSRCKCEIVIVDAPIQQQQRRNPEEVFGRRRGSSSIRATQITNLEPSEIERIQQQIAELKAQGVRGTDPRRRILTRQLRELKFAQIQAELEERDKTRRAHVRMARQAMKKAVGLDSSVERFGLPEILEPVANKSAYHVKGLGIHMDAYNRKTDPSAFDTVYRHEYGHYLDAALGNADGYLSYTPQFRLALNQDTIALLDAYGTEESAFVRSGQSLTNRQDLRMFADLAGAMTENRIGMGHSNEYYQRQGARETEAFANVIALLSSNDPNARSAARAIAPRFAERVAEAIGYESPD